ncbi:alpha/beta hydrolase [Paucibacter sp. B2R-40]|uniref:alpha/beta hydrolase n=1 Tax=Paucibacter sp. B2R-40 TaxID=2893554 RepID=UPI0021E4E575|nr:alpha/beta hydrolase [Paucibacter sp. B2R-40]MCV2352776.1 alpha/beta hydrolase [Paucibacter sp. B2R-40]
MTDRIPTRPSGLLRQGARIAATAGIALAIALTTASNPAHSATSPPSSGTSPCRIEGMPNELQCGHIKRPLNPAEPGGTQIDIHFLVVPAMARNKQPDPVLMLAGGPGQSAMAVAPMVMSRLARLNNRRDIVFIDQRGTGKSAPLQCADDRDLPIAEALDASAQFKRLETCRLALAKLPHGDMRFYSTTIAMQDFEAVRAALGAPQWNLIGGSYGTRAALEYLRLFPAQVRRTVLDGVAPPDMVLPASFSTDGQAALDASLLACEQEPACQQLFPKLRQEWAALLQSMPRQVSVMHPLTGQPESFTLSREMLLRSVRLPLYSPALAAALPAAIHAAHQGRLEGLMGLSGALASGKSSRLAMGMHFSVVCAEDVPRLEKSADLPGADFGRDDARLYTQVCQSWPRAQIAPAFFSMPPTASPVLLLSGGADPATPPRHGERAAKALGATNAKLVQHIVVPEAGHGVMGVGCIRELLFRFVDAKTDALALPQDAACAAKIPRPGAFLPVQASSTSAAKVQP